MSVFHNNALLGAAQPSGAVFDSTVVGKSVHLDGSNEHLTKSFSGSATSTEGLYSIWVQRNDYGNDDGIFTTRGTIDSVIKELLFSFRTDNKLEIYSFQAGGAGNVLNLKTSRVFRDTGWYHIIFSYKTSEAVISNRAALFVNGVAITEFDTRTFPTENYALARPFASVPVGIGTSGETGTVGNSDFFHGYIAQATFLDGQSIQGGDVTVSSFLDTFTHGTNGSQFVPKANADIAALATTAGGNSFCLDFADSSDLGNDISDNNHDFSPQNMAAANQSGNTPSLVCAKFNPLDFVSNAGTLGQGNTEFATGGNDSLMALTLPVIETGCYWEAKVTNAGDEMFGLWANSTTPLRSASTSSPHLDAAAFLIRIAGNGLFVAGSDQGFTSAGISTNDVLMFAYKEGQFFYGKNGTWENSADPEAETGELFTITNSSTRTIQVVFGRAGGSNVTYEIKMKVEEWTHTDTKPSWGAAINSANSPAPDHQGIDYFDTTLYEGNGGGQRVGDFIPLTEIYSVSNSVIFNDDDSNFLQKTPSGAGNSKKFTLSTWFKRANITGAEQKIFHCQNSSNNNFFTVAFEDDDQIKAGGEISGGATDRSITTNRAFKDTSQWFNLVVRVDTANATEANRLRIYVDGVEQSLASATYRATDEDWLWNQASELHTIGRGQASGSPSGTTSDFYLAETVHIDNDSLGPESFGQVDTSTNRWIPRDVSGLTFGTNGYYLDYEVAPGTSNGAGTDVSGNSNHYSESGFASTDQSNDTPTNNLPVWDGLDTVGSATPTLSEGNLRFTGADNGGRVLTFPFTRGKWYWEVDVVDAGASFYIGFATPAGIAFSSATPWNNNAGSFIAAPTAGHFLGTNGSGTTNLVNNFTAYIGDGDRLAVAFDADNKFAYFGEVGSGGSGSSLSFVGQANATGDPTSGAKGTGAAPFGLNILDSRVFYHIMLAGGTDVIGQWIFDPAGFNGTPPTGYSALSQDNLDAGSSKITSWAWIKNRDATDDHVIVDRVRGVEKVIHSNSNAAQATETNTIQRFLQRGVQVGNDVQVNTVNEDYVLWQWLIGEEASTGSTFTGGSPDITSTGIVATPGHFSVGVYEGSGVDDNKIAHGLGGQIETLWVKHFAADTDDWMIWHKDLSSDSHQLHLNTTDDQDTTKNAWGSNPDFNTNTFRVGATDETNKNSTGNSHIFYAFRSIPGVCKVGSYKGNSNDDGPLVQLGFKPSWFFVKEIGVSDASHDWFIIDSTRYKYNGSTTAGGVNGGTLEANDSTVEETQTANFGDAPGIDFLADGLKLRTNSGVINGSGRTYIYIAMAEIGGNGTLPPIYGR